MHLLTIQGISVLCTSDSCGEIRNRIININAQQIVRKKMIKNIVLNIEYKANVSPLT